MQSSWDFERLSEACNKAGCILCRLTGETTRRYLETFKDEMFTDVNVRAKLRSSRGFCNTHTWQLVQMGASLSLAQAYRDIITDEIEQLEKDGGRRRQRWFHPKNGEELSPCPACQQSNEALTRFVFSLRQSLPDSSFYTLSSLPMVYACSISTCPARSNRWQPRKRGFPCSARHSSPSCSGSKHSCLNSSANTTTVIKMKNAAPR